MEDMEIYTSPHVFLRNYNEKVIDFNPALNKILLKMKIYIETVNAAGLAAPQIGINKRFFVMRYGDWINPENILEVINPKIVILDYETETALEGCLSIPGIMVWVQRFKKIDLLYNDRNGTFKSIVLSGLDARVAQHEADHILGKLITDFI